MKTILSCLLLSTLCVPVSAATVQLDWISGTTHLADTSITSVSSVYSAWPSKALGLYKEKGYEVMLYGDYGYVPDIPVLGPGFIASNDPGVYQTSVAQTISRADGRRFSLSSLDTDVGANQIYFEYRYDLPDGAGPIDYVESASFNVTIKGDGGTHTIDPFSHSYIPGGAGLVNDRQTVTTADFGWIGSNSNFFTISSIESGQTACDPRVLGQASPKVQSLLPCSDPANFGKSNIFKNFPDGSQVSSYRLTDLGSQNWAWTMTYQPTLTAIPVPAAVWSLMLALVGLVGLKRRRGTA